MKAIFVSGIDYESPIQIGDHHLARQFAKSGWDIVFLSFPITPFHCFSKNKFTIKRRFHNFIHGGEKHILGNGSIWSYVPASLIIPKKIPVFGKGIYRYWHKFLFPQLKKSLSINNFDNVDLVYIRDPLQSYILEFIQWRYSIFRMADNDAGFDSYNEYYESCINRLAKKVDLLLYSAMNLENQVNSLNPKRSMFLPNGVDLDHFLNVKKEKPIEFQNIPSPIVIYAGSINYWFDFDLINYLSHNLSNISFVIIGPNEKFSHKFIPNKNLFLFGPIQYENIPNYLTSASVGIIPFDRKRYPKLVNSINPLKLFEYLACNLPVVSSNWDEIERLNSPAILCNDKNEFISAIQKSINDPINKENNLAFIEKYNWDKIFNKLMFKIEINNSS